MLTQLNPFSSQRSRRRNPVRETTRIHPDRVRQRIQRKYIYKRMYEAKGQFSHKFVQLTKGMLISRSHTENENCSSLFHKLCCDSEILNTTEILQPQIYIKDITQDKAQKHYYELREVVHERLLFSLLAQNENQKQVCS